VKETVSTIAGPIKEQDRHEFHFPLWIERFQGCEKGLRLAEVQGKEGIRKDRTGFRDLVQANESADGKTGIARVADAKKFPQDPKGFSVGVRKVNDVLVAFGIFELFLGVRFRRLQHPLGTVQHDQRKANQGVDGIDRETHHKEPVLVCNEIFQESAHSLD